LLEQPLGDFTMHRHAPYLSLLSLVLVSAPLTAADPPARFFFQKGDRIVFLGDSITCNRQQI
jgi:hypothetical protein